MLCSTGLPPGSSRFGTFAFICFARENYDVAGFSLSLDFLEKTEMVSKISSGIISHDKDLL